MDEREFSMRVRAMTDRLWRVAWSVTRSGADADDAVQEALLRAWRRIGSLRDGALFETWLTRILINEARRILRRRWLTGEANVSRPELVKNADLSDAIGSLPLQLRIPVILHYMEGYRTDEIAQMLRLPGGTVRSRLRRARMMLRTILEEPEGRTHP